MSTEDLKDFNLSTQSKIKKFINLLLTEDVLFSDNHMQNPPFSKMSNYWDKPNEIENCIVDVTDKMPDWDLLFSQLLSLQCEALQIRCYSELIDIDVVVQILEKLQGTCISQVEFMIKGKNLNSKIAYGELFEKFPSLVFVMLHSSIQNVCHEITINNTPIRRLLILQKRPLLSEKQCGSIKMDMLGQPSTNFCTELKSHQGCLNRKVSMRSDGQICNCPSLKKNYGSDLSKLNSIVRTKDFQNIWNLKNDFVKVCKNCEFRYVCTGCRAYLETPDSREKPAGCQYDPVKGVWETDIAKIQFSEIFQ